MLLNVVIIVNVDVDVDVVLVLVAVVIVDFFIRNCKSYKSILMVETASKRK